MPTEPRFSIVTCTWNSAATLGETLASLECQSWRDFEHVFVDGGSNDGTLDMLAAYSRHAPGNRRILRDVGGGISRAMNQGIAAARGAVVAHLHADDYYAGPEVLAQVARCFEATGASWVIGDIQVLKDGKLAPPFPMRPFSYRAYAAGRTTIPHPAVFVRRECFARVGVFDPGLRFAMDIDLWLRLAAVATRPSSMRRSPCSASMAAACPPPTSCRRARKNSGYGGATRGARRWPSPCIAYAISGACMR